MSLFLRGTCSAHVPADERVVGVDGEVFETGRVGADLA
jgi:hypothetical protein